MTDEHELPGSAKAARRERKLHKRRHGMQVTGRSVKTLLLTLTRSTSRRKSRVKHKRKK